MTDAITPDELLFDVPTPLGFRVRCTQQYWQLVITIKHPVMAGREEDVKAALQEPSEIRQSKSDDAAYLFYRSERVRRWVARLPSARIATAF